MAVEIAGDGDPVLLIHGLGATGNLWTPQAGVLARFFRVVRPDLPGSGRSPPEGEVSTARLVDAMVALLDRLDIGQAHVAGHSFGSVVAQHLAVGHPDRVRSLALIGPIQAPADPARKALRDRAQKARNEGLIGVADTTVQVGTSAETKAHRPEVAAFVRELVMRQDAAAYASTCDAVASVEPADVGTIRCPTLLVTGDEDATAPPKVVRALADKIPGSRMVVLGRCGHWTPLERAAEVADALLNFYLAPSR